jgi:hypothetical protein
MFPFVGQNIQNTNGQFTKLAVRYTRYRQIYNTFHHAQQVVSELEKMDYFCKALEHDPEINN